MGLITLRLRSAATGEITRVSIEISSSVAQLKEQLRGALALPPSARFAISIRPTPFEDLSFASRLEKLGVSHGDILFYKAEIDAQGDVEMDSGSAAASASTATGAIHCTHPVHMKCIHCDPNWNSPALESSVSASKCSHRPGVTCTKCARLEDHKSGRLRWLCRHRPDARCANCMNWGAGGAGTGSTGNGRCTHPSSTVCPRCIDKADPVHGSGSAEFSAASVAPSASALASGSSPASVLTAQCRHGSNARCVNCLPKVADEEEDSYVCTRHGPNGSCWACLEHEEKRKVRISAQAERHCSGVKVDFASANSFQAYLTRPGAPINRRGILYGTVDKDTQTVTVDVIYEPPQECFDGLSVISEDETGSLSRAATTAEALGLTEVGWIIAHGPYEGELPLSAWDVTEAARLQAAYGDTFVTLSLTVTEAGGRRMGDFEAFQVSDQCVRLHKAGRLGYSPGCLDRCSVSGLPVKVEGEDATEVDVHLFTVLVPIAHYSSQIKAEFPIENRIDDPQGQNDLNHHMKPVTQSKSQSRTALNDRLRDFHLLLYLSASLEPEDVLAIGECVRPGRDVEIPEGYQVLINALSGSL